MRDTYSQCQRSDDAKASLLKRFKEHPEEDPWADVTESRHYSSKQVQKPCSFSL